MKSKSTGKFVEVCNIDFHGGSSRIVHVSTVHRRQLWKGHQTKEKLSQCSHVGLWTELRFTGHGPGC